MEWPQPRWNDLQSYAIGAITLSVAALEAAINELYLEAIDKSSNSLSPLNEDQMALLAELWPEAEWFGLLRKYQVVLTACGKEVLSTGTEPFQSTSALIRVRNALVHFKPEWDHELQHHKRIEDVLRGRFQLNQLAQKATGRTVWFPSQCLGAGCARWACTTAVAFSIEFCNRLGIRHWLN